MYLLPIYYPPVNILAIKAQLSANRAIDPFPKSHHDILTINTPLAPSKYLSKPSKIDSLRQSNLLFLPYLSISPIA